MKIKINSSKLKIVLQIPFKVVTLIFVFMFFNEFITNYNLLFCNKLNEKYESYYNIKAYITDNELSGNIREGKSIKSKSDICYVEYCGLPQKGLYNLSEVEFIHLERKYFIFKVCIEDNNCMYNLPDNFIEEIKESKVKDAKFNLLWGLIFILISIANYMIMKRVILSEDDKL